MIIIEGPDNSGKSTLAAQLAKDISRRCNLYIPIKHAGGPGFSRTKLLDDINNLRAPAILDRVSFISEPVYALALQRDTEASLNACQAVLYSMLIQNCAMVVQCTGEINRLVNFKNHEVKAHETAEHVAAVEKNAIDIIRAYNQFYTIPFSVLPNYYLYDYTRNSYEMLLSECVNFVEVNYAHRG